MISFLLPQTVSLLLLSPTRPPLIRFHLSQLHYFLYFLHFLLRLRRLQRLQILDAFFIMSSSGSCSSSTVFRLFPSALIHLPSLRSGSSGLLLPTLLDPLSSVALIVHAASPLPLDLDAGAAPPLLLELEVDVSICVSSGLDFLRLAVKTHAFLPHARQFPREPPARLLFHKIPSANAKP